MSRIDRVITRCGAVLLAIAGGAIAMQTYAMPQQDQWVGKWIGIADDFNGRFHGASGVQVEIRRNAAGLEYFDADRQRGTAAGVPIIVQGNSFRAKYQGLWPTPIEVVGRISRDGLKLTLTISGDGMTGLEVHKAVLSHDDAKAGAYLAPRLDPAGSRAFDYHYRPPLPATDQLSVGSAGAVGIETAPLEAMVKSVLAETGKKLDPQTESILIMRHGKLVFEEYFWGQSADNPHIISSSAKSVTAILTGIAVDRGLMTVDGPATSYASASKNTLWGRDAYPITLRNLLSMSSGTAWDDSIGGVANPSARLLTTPDVATYVMGAAAVHPPGTFYNYDNGLPALVGVLIAERAHEPLDRFADEWLFGPLGIYNYRWTRLRDGSPLAAGGLYLRPRDMLKIGQMMLNGGVWNGRQIISSAWVHDSTVQQTAAGQYPYGYYWHLSNEQHRHVRGVDGFMALGQGGQIIAVFPALDMVVVTTAQNWQMKGLDAMPFHWLDDFILAAVKEP